MLRLFILLAVLCLSIVWLAWPYDPDPNNWIAFFPESDQRLPAQNYVYHLCEKLMFVALAWVIYKWSDKFKVALLIFFGLQILKLGDYLITYNGVWGRTEVFGKLAPVSSNTLSILIFALTMLVYYIKYLWGTRE